MFLIELHLDVVLEVLLIVDLNFLLMKLVDKYQEEEDLQKKYDD